MSFTTGQESTTESQRLPIIFGVTGHRDLRPEDLNALRRTVAGIFRDYREDYPHTPFILLSALAEGADRLVAEVALEQPDVRLVAPLPFEQKEYERDFVDPKSLGDFRRLLGRAEQVFEMPLAEGCTPENIQERDGDWRSRQYAVVGEFLARHSHVLIALWDGIDNSKIGGTVWVKKKRELWQAEASDRFQQADPLGYGPFVHVITPRVSDSTVPPRACQLATCLPRRGKMSHEEAPYQLVYGEMDVFNADVLEHQSSPKSSAAREIAAGYLYPKAKSAVLEVTLQSMRSLYATADCLAGVWQTRTLRSLRYVILGVLVAGLVFEGVSHVIHPVWGESQLAPFVFVFFLVAVACACAVRSWSARLKEHDKYLNYRALAEALRVQFFWRLAGVADSVGRNYEGRQWRELDWMRAAAHAQWVLTGADLPYRERGAAGAIAHGITEVREHWVVNQEHFFKRKAASEEKRFHRHKHVVAVLVFLGILGGLLTLGLLLMPHHTNSNKPDLVLPLALFLTAMSLLGAGLIHFRAFKLALEAHARRYKESLEIFAEAVRRLDLAHCDEVPPEELDSKIQFEATCLKVLRQLGREAIMENADWVLTYRERPLEVPLG
jgi:hypothetical protein